MRKEIIISTVLMIVGIVLITVGLMTNEPPIYKHKNKSDEKTSVQSRMADNSAALLFGIEVF